MCTPRGLFVKPRSWASHSQTGNHAGHLCKTHSFLGPRPSASSQDLAFVSCQVPQGILMELIWQPGWFVVQAGNRVWKGELSRNVNSMDLEGKELKKAYK